MNLSSVLYNVNGFDGGEITHGEPRIDDCDGFRGEFKSLVRKQRGFSEDR